MILPNDVLSRMVCSNFEPLGEPIRKTSVYVIISEYFIHWKNDSGSRSNLRPLTFNLRPLTSNLRLLTFNLRPLTFDLQLKISMKTCPFALPFSPHPSEHCRKVCAKLQGLKQSRKKVTHVLSFGQISPCVFFF